MNLRPSERAHIINVFGAYLGNHGELDLYWIPSQKRAAMRRVVTERATRRLPEDAIYVGRYRAPCPCDVYIGDLEAVLATLVKPPPPWPEGVHDCEAAA